MASDQSDRLRHVVFVCAHGAVRSRLAAAYFNQAEPQGWGAVSAGLEPQAELGETASRLLSGTETAKYLDRSPPHSVAETSPADAVIAIDCELDGVEVWHLASREPGPAMLDELDGRVRALAERIAGRPSS
jgi:protein-tyrosine-phosphatase